MTKNDNPFCETVLTQLTSLLALMQIWLHGNFQMSSPNVMTVSTFDWICPDMYIFLNVAPNAGIKNHGLKLWTPSVVPLHLLAQIFVC